MLGKCKNLLVRGVNWIGDAVMTLPSLRALRKALPEAKISLLVKPWVSEVFKEDPNIDEIIIYGGEYKGIIGKIKLSRMLNRKDFSGAILFQNAFEAAFITFLAKIKERIGYSSDGRGFLLTEAVPLPKGKIHHIDYYLNLLNQIGIKATYSKPYIYLRVDERLYARDTLKEIRRPILGINPGATYGLAKRWLPERFAEVSSWFIKDTGGGVVIFGGNTEVGIAQEIEYLIAKQCVSLSANSLLNLAGKTSLRELISLISECDVFVANDSGPMHIAYAVGTPLVAIFGSTDPQLTGPPVDSGVTVTADVSCSPCFKRTCSDLRCMYAITSDEVFYGIKKMLPKRSGVFFDRDGTLCKEGGYLNRYEDFHVFSDISSLRALKERGFKLIGVTNQSGIGRGIVDESFVKKINSIFIESYNFDDFYYCPHHPDDHCPCRKPELGMLLSARGKHEIDFKKSYVVGDKESDMLLAKAVGAKGILVKRGEAKESANANYIAEDLKDVVDFIIREQRMS